MFDIFKKKPREIPKLDPEQEKRRLESIRKMNKNNRRTLPLTKEQIKEKKEKFQREEWARRVASNKEQQDVELNSEYWLKLKFSSNDNLAKFEKIVEKYFHSQEKILDDLKNLEKTCKVFEKYQVEITSKELKNFLRYRFELIEKKKIFAHLENSNGTSVKDYVRSLMSLLGPYYRSKLYVLEDYLIQNEIQYEDLNEHIRNINEEQDLENFEKQLFDDNPLTSLADIDIMSGSEFEEFLEELFKKIGYNAKVIGGSGDQGGDLILTRLGEKIVVQAKRSSTPITNTAIQEVVGAIKYYSCDRGIVVTSNVFNQHAKDLAAVNGVELMDRDYLKKLLDQYY